MNRTQALEILGIREDDDYSEEDIKRTYHSKILQYHPDKNKSVDAADRFVEIQEAYNFIKSESHNAAPISDEYDYCGESYNDILKTFLSSILREETPIIAKIMELILRKICRIIEINADAIIDYLRNINRDTLKLIRIILSKYSHILHLSAEFFEKIDDIIGNDRTDEYILLNPTLEDLLSEDNVYILKHDDKSYLVPLWQHEMIFENNGNKNLIVKCFPILPDNMELDECNILTVQLQYNVCELWDREMVVELGGKSFTLMGNMFRLTSQPQRIEFDGSGVPYNNTDNVLDVSKRQSIIFMVTVMNG